MEIPKSHANVNAVGSDLTMSAAAVSDEPNSVEVGSDVPVELDSNNSSGKSITANSLTARTIMLWRLSPRSGRSRRSHSLFET